MSWLSIAFVGAQAQAPITSIEWVGPDRSAELSRLGGLPNQDRRTLEADLRPMRVEFLADGTVFFTGERLGTRGRFTARIDRRFFTELATAGERPDVDGDLDRRDPIWGLAELMFPADWLIVRRGKEAQSYRADGIGAGRMLKAISRATSSRPRDGRGRETREERLVPGGPDHRPEDGKQEGGQGDVDQSHPAEPPAETPVGECG